MRKLLFAFVLLGISVFLSFSLLSWGGDCEEEVGKISRTALDVSQFEKLVLNGSHTVFLTQSDNHKVEIETTENIKKLVSTKVSDGVWKINFDKCIKTKNGVKFYIETPNIQALTVNGSGDIISKSTIQSTELSMDVRGSGDIKVEVDCQSMNSSIKGSGDIMVKGKTEKQTASVIGSGDYTASDLTSENAKVTVNGSGDIVINVSESLEAKVNGSGDISYSGNPSNVDKQVNGSGDIESK